MRVLIGPNYFGLDALIPDLSAVYPQLDFSSCNDRTQYTRALRDVDILFGWLTRDEFLAAKSLKWVQSPSSGINTYLEIPEFATSEVLLTSARCTHGSVLADHVFAMILCHTRRIREAIDRQLQHVWDQQRLRQSSIELTGSTLGIIGLGCVGRAIAQRAAGFDMRVLAVDLLPADKPATVERLDGLDGMSALLGESDYIVVTVPYTPATVNLLGPKEFSQIKQGAFLVGISRGGIIDEAALAEALREMRLVGAAFDVFEEEPLPPDSELWDLEKLLITPHSAGGTQFEIERLQEIFSENLGRFLRGEFPLRNQIDKARGF